MYLVHKIYYTAWESNPGNSVEQASALTIVSGEVLYLHYSVIFVILPCDIVLYSGYLLPLVSMKTVLLGHTQVLTENVDRIFVGSFSVSVTHCVLHDEVTNHILEHNVDVPPCI